MAQNINAIFEGKLTCALKNDMRILANFHQSMFRSLKIVTLMGSFIQSRKCMRLTFTGKFSVRKMKNEGKFEEELTCQFKIEMSILTNFDLSTEKSDKFAL